MASRSVRSRGARPLWMTQVCEVLAASRERAAPRYFVAETTDGIRKMLHSVWHRESHACVTAQGDRVRTADTYLIIMISISSLWESSMCVSSRRSPARREAHEMCGPPVAHERCYLGTCCTHATRHFDFCTLSYTDHFMSETNTPHSTWWGVMGTGATVDARATADAHMQLHLHSKSLYRPLSGGRVPRARCRADDVHPVPNAESCCAPSPALQPALHPYTAERARAPPSALGPERGWGVYDVQACPQISTMFSYRQSDTPPSLLLYWYS